MIVGVYPWAANRAYVHGQRRLTLDTQAFLSVS
jgi:hypothetical protein